MDLKNKTDLANTPIVPSEIGEVMSRNWAAFGVTVREIEAQPLDLGNQVAVAMTQFKPTQVMQLSLAKTVAYHGYLISNMSLAGSIFDVASKRIVWRSSIDLAGRFSARINKLDPHKVSEEIVDALTAKLTADGLLQT